MRWLLAWTSRRGEGLSEAEVRDRLDGLGDDFDVEQYRGSFGWMADQLGDPVTVESVGVETDHRWEAVVVSPSGRRWQWTVEVTSDVPHRICYHRLQRALPPGVEIRVAEPGDAPALREVASRAPIRLTDASVVIDPGDDYFAACRLMGDSAVTFVATHAGLPIGIHCGVSFPVRVQGNDGTCCMIAHSRLLPEHSGGGIWGRLNDSVFEHFRALGGWQVPLAYVRPDNASAQRLGGADARWPTRPYRAVIDCKAAAGSAAGRPATEGDAERVVELINGFHSQEEFFAPYTVDRLTARLSRAPELYSWPNLLIGERAVVGVWARGEIHTRIPDDGPPSTSTRAAVLDYGCERGAETELTDLLAAHCARLVPLGISHLGVFSSPASPAADLLSSMAAHVEEYDLMPPGITEPASVAEHGIYVDPVYF